MAIKLVGIVSLALVCLCSGYGDCDDPFHIKKQTWSTSDSQRDIVSAYKIFPHLHDQNVLQFVEGNCAYSLKLEFPYSCFQLHAPTTYGRDPGLLTIDIFEKKVSQKWKHVMSDTTDKYNYDTFFDFNLAVWVQSLDEYIDKWISKDSQNDLNNQYFGIEWYYNLNNDLQIDSVYYKNKKFYSLLIHSPSSSIIYEFISFKKPSNSLYSKIKWLQSDIPRATFKSMNNPYPWNRDDDASIIPVRISRATTDIYSMYDWYVNVMEAQVLDYSLDGIIDHLNGDNVLTKYAFFSILDTQIEIQVIERPKDYTFGDFNLLQYEYLLLGSHDAIITTPYCGIDRWFDNHYGLTTWEVSGYLDRILYKIRQRKLKYRIYKETKEHTTPTAKLHLAELGLDELYIFFIFEPSGQSIQLMGDFPNSVLGNVPLWNQQWCEMPCPYGTAQGHTNPNNIYIDYDDYDIRNKLFHDKDDNFHLFINYNQIHVFVIILLVICIIAYLLYHVGRNTPTKSPTVLMYDDCTPLMQK